MRRRQAYAQQDEPRFVAISDLSHDDIGALVNQVLTSTIPEVNGFSVYLRCECGRSFDTEHGLKVHKARAKH